MLEPLHLMAAIKGTWDGEWLLACNEPQLTDDAYEDIEPTTVTSTPSALAPAADHGLIPTATATEGVPNEPDFVLHHMIEESIEHLPLLPVVLDAQDVHPRLSRTPFEADFLAL